MDIPAALWQTPPDIESLDYIYIYCIRDGLGTLHNSQSMLLDAGDVVIQNCFFILLSTCLLLLQNELNPGAKLGGRDRASKVQSDRFARGKGCKATFYSGVKKHHLFS